MKTLQFFAITICLFLFSTTAWSQTSDSTTKKDVRHYIRQHVGRMYGSTGIGWGIEKEHSFNSNFNILLRNKYGFSFRRSMMFRNEESLDKLYSINASREFNDLLARNRYGVEAGISLVSHGERLYYETGGFTTIMQNTPGLSLRAKYEYIIKSGALGLELAAYGNINKFYNTAGIEAHITFGSFLKNVTQPNLLNNNNDKKSPSARSLRLDSTTKRFYIWAGFGKGISNKGAGNIYDAGISWVFTNNWGIVGNAQIFAMPSTNAPDNYESGFLPSYPRDWLTMISLNVVKEFDSKDNNRRFGIEAGPSYVEYDVPTYVYHSGLFSFHETIPHISKTIGLSYRAKAEFLAAKNQVGLTLAVVGNINEYVNMVGLEACFTLGYFKRNR